MRGGARIRARQAGPLREIKDGCARGRAGRRESFELFQMSGGSRSGVGNFEGWNDVDCRGSRMKNAGVGEGVMRNIFFYHD